LLSAVVGSDNITTTFVPSSNKDVLTVSPGSTAEAAEILKIAAKDRWTVLPAGGASWLDAGNPLRAIDLIVSTKRLNRIVEHEPADLVAVAEAGVSLNRFNEELSQNGQWLPLDPPQNENTTIGAVV